MVTLCFPSCTWDGKFTPKDFTIKYVNSTKKTTDETVEGTTDAD